jgi:hypothetical protein
VGHAAPIRFHLECCHQGFTAGVYTFRTGNFLVRHSTMSSIKSCTSNKAFPNLVCNGRFFSPACFLTASTRDLSTDWTVVRGSLMAVAIASADQRNKSDNVKTRQRCLYVSLVPRLAGGVSVPL